MCLKKIVRGLIISSLILLNFGCGKSEEKIEMKTIIMRLILNIM